MDRTERVVYAEGKPMPRVGCTAIALSNVANIGIDQAHAIVDETRRKRQRTSAVSSKVIENAKTHGLNFRKLRMHPRTLDRFVREHPTGRFYVRKRGHAFAVIDGVVHDRIHSGARAIVVDAWELVSGNSQDPATTQINKP